MNARKSIKRYFKYLHAMANEPEPKLGDTRYNLIFLVFPLKLEGERRWWGWHMVEEEAVESVACMETFCYDVIIYRATKWVD